MPAPSLIARGSCPCGREFSIKIPTEITFSEHQPFSPEGIKEQQTYCKMPRAHCGLKVPAGKEYCSDCARLTAEERIEIISRFK